MTSTSSSSSDPCNVCEDCHIFKCDLRSIPLQYEEPDLACKLTPTIFVEKLNAFKEYILEMDMPSEDLSFNTLPDDYTKPIEKGSFDKSMQTRRDFGTNTERHWSLWPENQCYLYATDFICGASQHFRKPINPLGDLMRKPIKILNVVGVSDGRRFPCHCDGTPFSVYDVSVSDFDNPEIMKNRIPPGGFSAGLW